MQPGGLRGSSFAVRNSLMTPAKLHVETRLAACAGGHRTELPLHVQPVLHEALNFLSALHFRIPLPPASRAALGSEGLCFLFLLR